MILLMLSASEFSYGQEVKQCATMEQDSIIRARFPQRGTLDDFEVAIQRKINEINIQSKAGRTKATVISIPIIVHVVHNGEAVGSGTNLSKEQVAAQLEVLNEDFRRKAGTPGFNNSVVGADIEIEFCLSPVDEKGIQLTEPGIHRYRGGQATWTRSQIDGSLKPSTIWNPNLFYNIWTLNFGGEDANLLGYAQFPDDSNLGGLNEKGGPSTTDGVVVKYSSFGSADKGTFPVMQAPYNKGRTLSHETGHWLGLRHIWGDGPCGNDFVDDTPTQQNESRGCPGNKLSCSSSTPAMVQNYMDYSDDACMNIFTQGQKARIRAVMELSPRRKTLGQSNLCGSLVSEKPTAKFSSDKQTVLLGGEVGFNDLSSGFPTSWTWTFDGGDPNTSTLQNPRVKYNSPGKYKVTLKSKNALGESQPFEIADYITVSEEGLCGEVTNYLSTYTPSVVRFSSYGNYKGYLTGQNSLKSKAISELFANPQGYSYISGVKIAFGKVYSTKEDATVTVTVWNARGLQNGPGSIIEQKQILLKQIKEDIANNRPTSIVLDRETPVFNRPFQVGIELKYDGDSLAIQSSAEGEATAATSWIQSSTGTWGTYAVNFGANIALNIRPIVGMNPSVQVAASKTLIYPGEEVILNARGASIFVWNAQDGTVTSVAGPQLKVRPDKTTVYETAGSGLELCNKTALTTIYAREGTVTGLEESINENLSLFPTPGSGELNVQFENSFRGELNIQVQNILGHTIDRRSHLKLNDQFKTTIDASDWSSGIYFVTLSIEDKKYIRKWIKID
jgi:PKD repeat protein